MSNKTQARKSTRGKYLKNNISIILDSKLTLIYCILNIFFHNDNIFASTFPSVCAQKKNQLKPQFRLAMKAAERLFEILD